MKLTVMFGLMWAVMVTILFVWEIWAETEGKRLTASIERIDLRLGGRDSETVTLGVNGIEANRRNFSASLMGDANIVGIELLGNTMVIRAKKPGKGHIRIRYWGLKEVKDIPVTVTAESF